MCRDTHLGHALNKVLKSIIVNYQLLRGKKARYVPGWDCHGLPIELKVLQSMSDEQRRELTPIKLRRKARDFALKTVKAQREQFERSVPALLGVEAPNKSSPMQYRHLRLHSTWVKLKRATIIPIQSMLHNCR